MSKGKIFLLVVGVLVVIMIIGGASSSSETAVDGVQPSVQTTGEGAKTEDKPVEAESQPVERTHGYQEIYDEYAARLNAECPALSMMECAELSNEGVGKMATYMYTASGTDGQYATYEKWSGDLMNVYLGAVQ